MKLYEKKIDGVNHCKPLTRIVLRKNGMQIFNPTEEMVLEDGWVEYVPKEPTEQELFEMAKRNKILEIEQFDKSDDVNLFYINGEQVWLDFEKRSRLLLRFQAEHSKGCDMTTLWYNGKEYQLLLSKAIQMLYELESYASLCYDNTQRHIAAVNNLETIERLDSYDYRAGYPEKLEF